MKQSKVSKKRGTQEAQEAIRIKLIKAVKGGLSIRKAAMIFGVSYSAARSWCKQCREKGIQSLNAKKRGRRKAQSRMLTPLQERKLRHLIADKQPDQLKLPFMLWERRAVQELVVKRYGVKIALNTVSDYLKRWGMSCQRPGKSFYQRDDKQAKQWQHEVYPELRERAKKENAEIQWVDESSVCNRSSSAAKGFAKKGHTPVLKENARKERINFISSVTNQGKVRFMVYEGKFDSAVFLKFLERSVKGAKGRKIMMITDNYRVHKSKTVEKWLEERSGLIELQYLPPYCPDLNPDEYLNCDVKSNVHRERMPKDKKELKQNTLKVLRIISRRPDRVKSYFNAKSIAYAV